MVEEEFGVDEVVGEGAEVFAEFVVLELLLEGGVLYHDFLHVEFEVGD